MNDTVKTATMIGVAAVTVLLAVLMAPGSPTKSAEFAQISSEYFPDFNNPLEATKLQVATYDPEIAKSQVFVVENRNGKWVIPSRDEYPADGKDQLAKTATSLIAVRREALVGRSAAQHGDFGVIDPLGDAPNVLEGIGNRVTLYKGSDVLADLIIGKAVPNQSGYFYVRKADEAQVYKAKLNLNVSTKFSNWIEPDLLKLDAIKLVRVLIDKYTVDVEKGRLIGKEPTELSRKTSAEPWTLDPIDPDTEQVDQDGVRKLVDALDDLKIVGVRKKPIPLTDGLQLDKNAKLTPEVMGDMLQRGFFFASLSDGGTRLISKEGDLKAGTNEGVVYELHFGELFSGTDADVERGIMTTEKPAGDKPADPNALPETKKNRYLLVVTSFDPELLGDRPEAPILMEPAPAPTDGPVDATNPVNGANFRTPEQDLELAKARFAAEQAQYDVAVKAYDDKLTAGKKLVKELNSRFADWYYVISSANFENLRQSRATLVKPKVAPSVDATLNTPPVTE